MASVSLVGPLAYAETVRRFPDTWYLRSRSQHPPWTRHRVVRAPAASSRCKEQCTVTFGLIPSIESFCKDLYECLTKPADGESFICMGDTLSVTFLRVPRGEQRGNWHGGEFLDEDDYYSLLLLSSASRSCANCKARGGALPLLCFLYRTATRTSSYRSPCHFRHFYRYNAFSPYILFPDEDNYFTTR